MPDPTPSCEPMSSARQYGPWSVAGGADPDYDDAARSTHHALLTDPDLVTHFRRRFSRRAATGYDEMVRMLEWVWDCSFDGVANVTGYRCAGCGRTRAAAMRRHAVDSRH